MAQKAKIDEYKSRFDSPVGISNLKLPKQKSGQAKKTGSKKPKK